MYLQLNVNYCILLFILAKFKAMYEQKLREHNKAFDQQQKQLTALKKGGKSGKQAVEEVKGKMKNKAKKGGKKGQDNDGK